MGLLVCAFVSSGSLGFAWVHLGAHCVHSVSGVFSKWRIEVAGFIGVLVGSFGRA